MHAGKRLLATAICAVIALSGGAFGPRSDPALAFDVAEITASGNHSCALLTAGALACWGWNAYGQLGDGTLTSRTTPVSVSGLGSDVLAVDAGGRHTCAVVTGGGLRCWGWNVIGQLGDGTLTSRTTPVAVSGLQTGVVAVAGGRYHTCAVTSEGGVKCWGDNSYGQLGDGTTANRTTPVDVSGLSSGVAAVAAGAFHTCALTTQGGLRCWGHNTYGQLGNGASGAGSSSTTPVAVVTLQGGVAAVATGTFHTCAHLAAGGAKCWGWNAFGQVGDGTTANRATPVVVSAPGSSLIALDLGATHSCAVILGGGMKCWGDNAFGQLGNGTFSPAPNPVPMDVVGLSSGIAAVAGGGDHTCALTSSGVVVCWGQGLSGQLGDGTATPSNIPVDVSGLNPKPTPTHTATPSFTPTPTITPTPKDPAGDTDGDTLDNSSDPDDDNDGCTDIAELGSNPAQGGLRSPHDFWDFFDTPDLNNVRDGAVTVADVFAAAGRFGATGDPNNDPLAGPIPAPPAYHTAFDRGGQVGANIWNQAPADGAIAVGDIFAVAAQFGHTCA